MTYRELREHLESLEDEQLDFDVMCLVDEEYYQVVDFRVQEKDDHLGDGHPYVVVE